MTDKKRRSRRRSSGQPTSSTEEQQAPAEAEVKEAEAPQAEAPEDTPASGPDPEATLWDRILWVRSNLPNIRKDKDVGYGKSAYGVVTHEYINQQLLPLLNKAGLVDWVSLRASDSKECKFETQNGRPYLHHHANYTYFLRWVGDKGKEALSIEVEGIGEDTADKGPGKARTYALKYARNSIFSIAAGEYEEDRADDKAAGTRKNRGPVISPDQLDQLLTLADELWGDDASKGIEALCKHQGFMLDKIDELPSDLFDIACQQMKRWHEAQQKRKSKDDLG